MKLATMPTARSSDVVHLAPLVNEVKSNTVIVIIVHRQTSKNASYKKRTMKLTTIGPCLILMNFYLKLYLLPI